MKFLYILLALILSFSNVLANQPFEKFMYVKMLYGSNFFVANQEKSADFQNDKYTFRLSYDDGGFSAIGSLASGMQVLELIGTDLEIIFTELKPKRLFTDDANGLLISKSSKIASTNPALWVMLNGTIEIPTSILWKPAFTVGLGYVHSRIKYNFGGDTTETNKTNTFGMNFMITHRFYINKSFIFNLGVRYLYAPKTKFLEFTDGQSITSKLLITTFEGGFTYKFL